MLPRRSSGTSKNVKDSLCHEAGHHNESSVDPDLGFFCNSHITQKQAVYDKKLKRKSNFVLLTNMFQLKNIQTDCKTHLSSEVADFQRDTQIETFKIKVLLVGNYLNWLLYLRSTCVAFL